MERSARLQQYYINENCTEIVIDYETACGLINLLNANLKTLALSNELRLAILFLSNATPIDSPINDEVISDRILAAVEHKIVHKSDCSLSILNDDIEGRIQLYFNM